MIDEASHRGNNMKTILIATCIALLGVTAAAAKTRSSTEYFVVLDTKTKTCTVADKKTKTKTLKIVGDATYRTQAEAERNENHQSLHQLDAPWRATVSSNLALQDPR
jgi:hypothetical protein